MAAGGNPPDDEQPPQDDAGEPPEGAEVIDEEPLAARLQALPDRRRVLPTEDWVSHVDRAQFEAVAQTQILATSHFYKGLVSLKAEFAQGILLPPAEHRLPRALRGAAKLPDGRPAADIAVSVLAFHDVTGVQVLVP